MDEPGLEKPRHGPAAGTFRAVTDIGTLREGPLHASLKRWYAEPGDVIEHAVDGLVIDIVRGDLLIEIQTGGFAPLRSKLDRLLPTHRVRIVHPVAVETVIVKVGDGGEILSERRSPTRAQVADVAAGLVSIAGHLTSSQLEIDVVETVQRQIRRHEPGRARRRRGWVIDRRELLDVRGTEELRGPRDLLGLLPVGLDDPFTTADIAEIGRMPRRTAQQLAYSLREAGALVPDGRGSTPRYRRTGLPQS